MPDLNKKSNKVVIIATIVTGLLLFTTIFAYLLANQTNHGIKLKAQKSTDNTSEQKLVAATISLAGSDKKQQSNQNSTEPSQIELSAVLEKSEKTIIQEASTNDTIETKSIKSTSEETTSSETEQNSPQNDDYKYIALTFDDGPYHDIDLKVLDLLTEHDGHATFFVLGSRIDGDFETIKAVIEQGSELGNHSFSHADLAKLNYDQIMAEINLTNAKIQEYTGVVPTLIRPPYGSYNEQVLAALPYPIMIWDHDTIDWLTQDAEQISERLEETLPGSVVLMHSMYPETLAALEQTLPKLYEQGYRFVTVSELYHIYGVDLVPHGRHSSPADELGR